PAKIAPHETFVCRGAGSFVPMNESRVVWSWCSTRSSRSTLSTRSVLRTAVAPCWSVVAACSPPWSDGTGSLPLRGVGFVSVVIILPLGDQRGLYPKMVKHIARGAGLAISSVFSTVDLVSFDVDFFLADVAFNS